MNCTKVLQGGTHASTHSNLLLNSTLVLNYEYDRSFTRTAGYEEGLYEAACIGDEEVVRELIERGAMVNFPNMMDGMQSALHAALTRGNLEAAIVLLNNNGDLDQKDEDGLDPLEASRAVGREDMVVAVSLFLANLL
ncbi:hypothetical protein AAMO2058_001224600 [Amorphochlora amoebiformis]